MIKATLLLPFFPSLLIAQLGPGDSIGYTVSDYLSNGSVEHNIINFGDGTLAIGRMMALTDDATDRGTYYSYSSDGGASWSPFSWIEGTRQGGGNIDYLPAAGGTEVIVSHYEIHLCVDAVKGANVWSCGEWRYLSFLWPRLAVTDPFNIHVFATDTSPPSHGWYFRSTDAGASWDIVERDIFFLPGYLPGYDSYDIAGYDSSVAIVSAGGFGDPDADVLLAVSGDNGTTWAEQVLLDQAGRGELPPGEMEFHADGSIACVYDHDGNLHAVWTNFLAVGNAFSDPELFYQIDAPLRYWSNSTGIVDIIPTVHDTSIIRPFAAFGNLNTQPDIAVDSMNNIYIIYQQQISEQDTSGTYLQHIYATGSSDGGFTWNEPFDITPGEGFDASYGAMSDLVDENLHIVYYSDPFGGTYIRGNHDLIPVAVMYLAYPAVDVLTLVAEVPATIPTKYELRQNYPNPFNPRTEIRYHLPAGQAGMSDVRWVTLTIYDILGREIATLVDEKQEAGFREVEWDATGQPSGVYFYRLKVGEFVETRKLVLLR